MSQILNPSSGGGGGSGIQTIDGTIGSVTGTTVTFNVLDSNAYFSGSGSLMELVFEDANDNLVMGSNLLPTFTTGNNNLLFGQSSGESLTTGQYNTGFGANTINLLVSGQANMALGVSAGSNYTGSESSNICILNHGVVGESNVIRIGIQGTGFAEQNQCYIAGITGVTVSNPNIVQLNTSTGQLGAVASVPSSFVAGITTAPAAGFIGEQIRATASAIGYTTTTPKNLTSISLTAGVWDISAIGDVIDASSVNSFQIGISLNSASFTGTVESDSSAQVQMTNVVQATLTIPAYRMTLTTTTTVYLVGEAVFSSGTPQTACRLSATRVA